MALGVMSVRTATALSHCGSLSCFYTPLGVGWIRTGFCISSSSSTSSFYTPWGVRRIGPYPSGQGGELTRPRSADTSPSTRPSGLTQ
jgi:hypothetical protein